MSAWKRQLSHGVSAWQSTRAVACTWSTKQRPGTGHFWRALTSLPLERAASSVASRGGAPGVANEASLGAAASGGVVAVLAAAGVAYWTCYPTSTSTSSTSSSDADSYKVGTITDEVFDNEDNLFVFFLERAEDVLDRKEDMQRVVRAMAPEPSLSRVKYYFNVIKEGDPPVPTLEASGAPAAAAIGGPAAVAAAPLRVVLYKGQRKILINVGEEIPRQQILDFYVPVSEDLTEASRKMVVQKTSNKTFAEDVIAASSPTNWVLLQQFEDTCFLCFLMRPFVNSMAELLKAQGLPLQVKRLNVEKNDFPDGCPVARGTPTFVLFRGADTRPVKWEEFKPKDVVERLIKEFPQLPDELQQKMDSMQNLVSRRFQLFTQLVMWTVELGKLEALLASSSESTGVNSVAEEGIPGTGDTQDAGAATAGAQAKEESAFNTVVSNMMAKDMKRTDGIMDNLAHLQREVDEVEHDAALMGVMLAEAVMKQEGARVT